MKPFIGFLLCCVSVAVAPPELVIYEEINTFRSDPYKYVEERNWVLGCDEPIGSQYPLTVIPELEDASRFQAETLASNECTEISHETCPQYCYLFGDCSCDSRVKSFMGDKSPENIQEILIKGPKNPVKVIKSFIASTGHCNHLLAPDINSMGATFRHIDKSVSVITFAFV